MHVIAFSLLTALPGLPWSPRSPDIPGAPLIKTTARNKQTKESKMLNLKKNSPTKPCEGNEQEKHRLCATYNCSTNTFVTKFSYETLKESNERKLSVHQK